MKARSSRSSRPAGCARSGGNGNNRNRNRVSVRTRALRLVVAAALAASCGALLCSCRPTDFFTEVIISPFAEQIDESNAQKLVVNTPAAEQTSTELSALDWSDNAPQSSETQNVVTYSSNPTTNMDAFRSLYGLNPRFPGAQSSDPVQLDFTQNSTTSDSNSQQQTETDNSADQTSQLEGSAAIVQGTQIVSDASGTGDAAGNAGADNGTGDGDGQSGGYDGPRKTYNPNDKLADPPTADKIAGCGQVAVMVEALGGSGALAAMDVNTYNGSGSSATAGSFASVFGDELSSDFAQTALLWDNDGTSAGDLADAQALAQACGTDGVIVYDEGKGELEDQFSAEALAVLDSAGITYIPVQLNTVQGILDAVEVIGKVLSQSATASQNAQANASAYWQEVSDIVSAAAGSHGGTLAAKDQSTNGSRLLTTYNSCPVGATQSNGVFTVIGTSYVSGLSYDHSPYSLDASSGVLFATGEKSSPLSFWAQSAGVWNRAADYASLQSSKTATGMIYGVVRGATSGFEDGGSGYFINAIGSLSLAKCTARVLLATEDKASGTTSESNFGDGLGSAAFPYLIVSGSNGLTSAQVKSSVVSQMTSSGLLNPYSILPWNGASPNNYGTTSESTYSVSVIGSTTSIANKNVFIEGGVSASESVRANPSGLLGSWTEGSMESVLESAWLARIYSAAPANSTYDPICSYSKSELQQAVTGFYQTFYRMSASEAQSAYNAVVTDEGL